MGSVRTSWNCMGLVVLAGSVMVLPAGATVRVGPNQYFTGVINGHDGNTTSPITVPHGLFRPGNSRRNRPPHGGSDLGRAPALPAHRERWVHSALPATMLRLASSSTCFPRLRRVAQSPRRRSSNDTTWSRRCQLRSPSLAEELAPCISPRSRWSRHLGRPVFPLRLSVSPEPITV